MRLSPDQIHAIKTTAQDVLGDEAQVLLFGSRVDDSRKGGDIDLYIQGLQLDLQAQQQAKARFLAKLKQAIGEQRIDVVFAPGPGQIVLPVHQSAESTGIAL
jgi:hypothetical protein